MRINLLPVLVYLLFLLFSCKKYKPADPAFFIKAGTVSVATNPITQGSGSNKITDFWLYVNGQFQGTYPVGSLMPIPTKDKHAAINVFAGIKNNGIAKTRIPWTFYQQFDLDTAGEAGNTIERNFSFKYKDAVVFAFTESFDDVGFKMIKSPISDVTYSTTANPNENFEGKSMYLELPLPNDSVAQIETAAGYALPFSTGNVYLEFNYKCNNEFSVGIIGGDGLVRPVLYVNPDAGWNKMYVSLATELNAPPTFASYKVYFRMLRTSGNTGDLKMFLDNIKLVYI